MDNFTLELLNIASHPGILMICLGFVVFFVPGVARQIISIAAPIAAGLVFLKYYSGGAALDLMPYMAPGEGQYDKMSYAFFAAVCLMACLCAINGAEVQNRFECGASLIYAGCIMEAMLSCDCITLVAFTGASAAAGACIIGAGGSTGSGGAAVRYLLIQMTGCLLILAAFTSYLFHYEGGFFEFSSHSGDAFCIAAAAGIALIAALPPIHGIVSDSFAAASVPGSACLTPMHMMLAAYLAVRLLPGYGILVLAGSAAAVFAACMAVAQNNLRTTGTYAAVCQICILAVLVGALPESENRAMMIAVCAIISAGSIGVLMMCLGAAELAAGAGKKAPVAAICFIISALSVTGFPGTAGYICWTQILDTVQAGGSTRALALITVSEAGLLVALFKAAYGIFTADTEPSDDGKSVPVTMTAALILGAAAIIVIGLKPDMLPGYKVPEGAHFYSVNNIIRYAAVFAGSCIPFLLHRSAMKTDGSIILDFDWIVRKPLRKIMEVLAGALHRVFTGR